MRKPMTEFQYDVILSYSGPDQGVARAIAVRLRADGLRVWPGVFTDGGAAAGVYRQPQFEAGLEDSRVLVLLLSAQGYGADWAQLEAGAFRFRDPAQPERRFIPLRLDEAPSQGALAHTLALNWLPEARETEYAKLLEACRSSAKQLLVATLPTSPLLKAKIEEARRAARMHDDENAIRLWEEAQKCAEEEGDKAAVISARLEAALLRMQSSGDLDDGLFVLDECIQDAKSIDLGDDRCRLLQLLGEAHRLKGNFDQARGFITSALEHGRSLGRKLDEGWGLLALAALEKTIGKQTMSEAGLDLIQQAYDCFSSVYVSGDQEKQRAAKQGFANCHFWRAEIFDRFRLDDAMAEYARALDVFRELGKDHDWNVADTLFRRGELHASADDPQLAWADLRAAGILFEEIGDHTKVAACMLTGAHLLDKLLRREEARPLYKAAAVSMQEKNPKRAGWYWLNYAWKLMEFSEYEEAKSIFLTILEGDWLTQGQRLDVLRNLCLITKATEQKDELERYSKAALEIIDDQIANAKFAHERRRLIISKGQALEELEEHDRAIACLQRAIEGFEAIHDREGIGECWFHIAGIMRQTDKRKEEREAYEKVLDTFGDKGNSFFLPLTRAMLTGLDISEQHFDDARKHLSRAEQENERLLNPLVLLITAHLSSKLEEHFAGVKTVQQEHEPQEPIPLDDELDNESKERKLVGQVISTVALAGQLSREFTVSDHGIDMEIEFKSDAGEATGRKLYLQLKSGDSYLKKRKSDGAEIFTIKDERHARYWMEQAFPVLLIVRNSSGEIRWMEVREYLKAASQPIKQIVFSGERFDVMCVRRWRDAALRLGAPAS